VGELAEWTSMATLFISHSSQDQAAMKRVIERLDAERFAAVFLDFDPVDGIPAGRARESELYVQVAGCQGRGSSHRSLRARS
jgi:hypothetical protein